MRRVVSSVYLKVYSSTSQYAHNVVLTSVRRRFNVMDVIWMSKRCRVLTGLVPKPLSQNESEFQRYWNSMRGEYSLTQVLLLNQLDRYVFLQNAEALKGGSRLKNWCMVRVLSFLIRYFSNYYTLHRSDLAARAAPLDPRLSTLDFTRLSKILGFL